MLPGRAQAVSAAMPPTYIVDGVRQVLLGGAGLDAAVAVPTLILGVSAARSTAGSSAMRGDPVR